VPSSSQPDSSIVEETEYSDMSGYSVLLDEIYHYSFLTELTGNLETAKTYLDDNGIEYNWVFSEEESIYNLDFTRYSADLNSEVAFHFEYNSDEEYSCLRHIIQNIKEEDKTDFIEELKIWLSSQNGLDKIEPRCFNKNWGATGYFWEEQLEYTIRTTQISRSTADGTYPWIEIRISNYREVDENEIVSCL